jgi:hypothetical protein
MKQNGLDTYESDAKKQSRRIIAEELFRRIKDPTNATVLYLPGPHDYQRKSLLNIGFRNENIFGVDFGKNVQAVRDRGGYCIEGKLHEVIDNWPSHRRLNCILADLCCGLDTTATETIRSLGNLFEKTKIRPVVYLNMQRGRDAKSNGIREFLSRNGAEEHTSHFKHRVVQLFMWQGQEWAAQNIEFLKVKYPDGNLEKLGRDLIGNAELAHWSYRNSVVSMDSAVFLWPEWLCGESRPPIPVIKARIAATLATATRRRNERLAA